LESNFQFYPRSTLPDWGWPKMKKYLSILSKINHMLILFISVGGGIFQFYPRSTILTLFDDVAVVELLSILSKINSLFTSLFTPCFRSFNSIQDQQRGKKRSLASLSGLSILSKINVVFSSKSLTYSVSFQFYPRSTVWFVDVDGSVANSSFNSIQDQHEVHIKPIDRNVITFNSIQDQHKELLESNKIKPNDFQFYPRST